MENSDIKHIAIIMDGNRRWARSHNLDTKLGLKKGAEVLETISRYCNKIGLVWNIYRYMLFQLKTGKEQKKKLEQ